MNDRVRNGKTSWFTKYLYPPISAVLIAIVIQIISSIIILRLINPPPLPDIESTVVYNTGPSVGIESPFRLDLQADKDPWLVISIINKGDNDAEKLEIGFYLSGKHNILNIQRKYNPRFLEKRMTEPRKQEAKSFYAEVSSLPTGSGIEYRFHFDRFIKSLDEFELSVCSKSKNWSKSTVIKAPYSKSKTTIMTNAYADDKIKNDSQPDVPKSEILIGGYDPLAMSNGLFHLVQTKGLISKPEAAEIKTTVESYKKGILFGGINLLKFNELIMGGLLSNQVITKEQANAAIEKSKNAGGVMIGGYNVIVLEVDIMNLLLRNKRITFEEGQKVIDYSKFKSN